jgi:sporulation protein YlmC with PRC-barrel domain
LQFENAKKGVRMAFFGTSLGASAMSGLNARSMAASKEVIDLPVVDSAGESVGKLHDIVIDLRTGRIAYGIVTLDRVPDWSERVVAIPWNAMHLDRDNEHLCVNAARDWVERAPAVHVDAMLSLLDHDSAVLIHSFFGTRPYWEAGSQQYS